MRIERLHRMAIWLQDLARGVSEIFQIPEPILVPVRIEETYERGLLERRRLLARTRPRQPPFE